MVAKVDLVEIQDQLDKLVRQETHLEALEEIMVEVLEAHKEVEHKEFLLVEL
ncbi:hypothetical protein [uncultured phage MedDCM-OCT-S08-C582]|nr:hypothetical protein [uncultured phage MedDCM-OCT-S08-C582]